LTIAGVPATAVAEGGTAGWEIVELPTLPGGTRSEASFVDDRGTVVGVSDSGEYAGLDVVRWGRDGRVTKLPAPPDTVLATRPVGLNDHGEVAATVERWVQPPSTYHAVRWDATGRATLLPGLSGHANSGAVGIADDGSVVGTSYQDAQHVRAVRWEPDGRVVDLDALPGGANSYAIAANGRGDVIGSSETANGHWHAVRWDRRGRITDLGPGDARGVNDRGEVAGFLGGIGPGVRPVRWDVRGRAVVGEVPAGRSAEAVGINNHGTTVGTALVGGPARALRWDRAGRVTVLEVPDDADSTSAYGINDRGQVIGYVQPAGAEVPTTHAAYWDPRGSLTDLGVLPGFANSYAADINRRGDVVGQSRGADDSPRAVLWRGHGASAATG
jgi:probable HAF family extracellular repeat protein